MTYKEFLSQGGEKKWQDKWLEDKIDKAEDFGKKPKQYVLDMFPYPSGAGLHVGHPEGYTATDIYSRYLRLKGKNVLHLMGWDAFGLPAENYAIKTGTHPKITTEENISVFKRQIQSLGFSYDWDREIDTTDPNYYKWTQWIFLQLFKKGLAYEATVPINFCPSCKTGLANEEVSGGQCERCGSQVERRDMRQWMLKITAYADRLLTGLDKLNWPESIKTLQRNWIGRSEGADVDFAVIASPEGAWQSRGRNTGSPRSAGASLGMTIKVYTTRPDTLFGATYMVLSPEHPLIKNLELRIKNWDEVNTYIVQAKNKSDLERTELAKEKTGVELKGIKAINPVNNAEIPIWISDYVLASYGTGAIMAVPAHDERDFEFAKKFGLPMITVVATNKDNVIGMGAMIEVGDGKFLFQRRDNNTDRNPGMLAFFGGGIENNEDTEETLKREIKEELNLKVNNFVLLNKLESHNKLGKFLDIFYVRDINEKNIKLNEGAGIERLTLSEALNKDDVTQFTKEAIKCFIENRCFTDIDNGIMVNSDFLNGLVPAEAIGKMTDWLEEKGFGKKAINYKLRDWVFSRQRYWGEPIPLVHCEKDGIVPLDEKDLPLKLPEVEKYEPTGTGESPLSTIYSWVNTTCPKCGGPGLRETNTIPQWAGSSWYWLRFIDPKNDQALADKKKLKYWLPVDLYLGGAEHAVLHLLYARFWNMFLYDIGAVPQEEPFAKLVNQGLILGEDGEKMSKSRGNVVNPDDILKEFGADTFRMYEMFMGPLEAMKPWSTQNIMGVYRFLNKVWELGQTPPGLPFRKGEGTSDSPPLRKVEIEGVEVLLHKTIKKVGEDVEKMSYNTAIAAMMVLANKISSVIPSGVRQLADEAWGSRVQNNNDEIVASPVVPRNDVLERFLIILSPFAPHLAEELWSNLSHQESIFKESWPEYDESKIKDEEVEVPVQVNGKVRAKLMLSADISEAEATRISLADERVKKYVIGEPKKVIFVKGKMISIVV